MQTYSPDNLLASRERGEEDVRAPQANCPGNFFIFLTGLFYEH